MTPIIFLNLDMNELVKNARTLVHKNFKTVTVEQAPGSSKCATLCSITLGG